MVCKDGGKESGLCRIRHEHLHRPFTAVISRERLRREGTAPREWAFYVCARCGGIVTAYPLTGTNTRVQPIEYFPGEKQLDESILNEHASYSIKLYQAFTLRLFPLPARPPLLTRCLRSVCSIIETYHEMQVRATRSRYDDTDAAAT